MSNSPLLNSINENNESVELILLFPHPTKGFDQASKFFCWIKKKGGGVWLLGKVVRESRRGMVPEFGWE